MWTDFRQTRRGNSSLKNDRRQQSGRSAQCDQWSHPNAGSNSREPRLSGDRVHDQGRSDGTPTLRGALASPKMHQPTSDGDHPALRHRRRRKWCEPKRQPATEQDPSKTPQIGRIQESTESQHQQSGCKFEQNLGALIRRLADDRPTKRVPSPQECRFCDISAADCPVRIDADTSPEDATTSNF